MLRRILIVQGHPDPDPHRLCRALADAHAEGAIDAGHAVERLDLAVLGFPLLRTRSAFETEPVPDSLRAAAQALRSADHLALFFPLWLGSEPALVKAFLEQVMRPGVAFEYAMRGLPKKLLAGRSARVVVTMGMPGIVYRVWFAGHGLSSLRRNILNFVGFSPVRQTIMGSVETASDATRQGWLGRMSAYGAKAI